MILITDVNKILLVKRLKSLLWRIGGMVIALGMQFSLDNLGLLNLPAEGTVFLGLILGEISKHVNNAVSGKT